MTAYPKVWRGAHADMTAGARAAEVPAVGDLVQTLEGGQAIGDGVTPLRGLAPLARAVLRDLREYQSAATLGAAVDSDETAILTTFAADCAADGVQPFIPRTKYGLGLSGRVAFSKLALPVGAGWWNQALGATPGPGSGFRCLTLTSGVDIGALTGAGMQGGTWGGFFVNGNGIARQPLHVGLLAFARGHGTVRVTGTVGNADPTLSHGRSYCAYLIDRLQNGELPQLQADNLGGSAFVFDYGTGGWILPAVEIAKIQGYQMEFLDSNPGSSDSIYPTGPSNINILKGIIERAGGDSGNFLGGIYIESGQDIYFHPGVAFALPSGLNVETAIFKLRKTGNASPQLHDLGVIVNGDKSATVIYDVGANCRVNRPSALTGHHKAAKYLYKLDAQATVTTDGGDTLSPNVRGLLHPASTGTLAGNVATIVRSDSFAVRPSSAAGIVFSTRLDATRILCSSTTTGGVTTMHRAGGETSAFTAAMQGASIQIASDTGDDIFKTTVALFVDADTVTLTAPLTTDVASAVVKVSEKADRLTVDATGKQTWGDGSAAGDVDLYRGGADLLQTDDDVKVRRMLRGTTTVTLGANNARTFDAGVADRYILNLNNFNATSLTITNHSAGQLLEVVITQGNTTLKTVTWAAGPVWQQGFSAPAVPAVLGATLVVTFLSDGTNLFEIARSPMDIADNAVTSVKLAAAVRASIVSGATAWAATTAVTAGQVVQLPTGGLAFRTAAGTTRATFDATERDLWTFLPGGHYEKVTASGAYTWKCPVGITQALVRLLGGSGGGGGGGTGHATTQVGGAGGGAGAAGRHELAVTAGHSYSGSVGAGGAGGAGGASGGNPGIVGTVGGGTTFVDDVAGVTYAALGGTGGNPGLATSAANAIPGVMGGGPTASRTTQTFYPGAGGTASSTQGGAPMPVEGLMGGGAGGPATATLGGQGGNTRQAPGASVASQSGATGNTAGGAGQAVVAGIQSGGGGGGGGAPGGAGGAGSTGSPGTFEAWF